MHILFFILSFARFEYMIFLVLFFDYFVMLFNLLVLKLIFLQKRPTFFGIN